MNIAEQFDVDGLSVKICWDEEPMNPRDRGTQDNFGIMACWHSRYNLGDEQHNQADTPQEWHKALPKGSIALPLYLYDHSGITMSTGEFSCPWDSGQIGWIYATPAMIRKEYNIKRITKAVRDKAEKLLQAEVEEYDLYLTGQCYGYIIEDEDGGTLDSCWGFLGGIEYCINEAKGTAQQLADNRINRMDIDQLSFAV